MNQFQVIVLICWTCSCWAYNRYEPSYVHFELDSDEIDDSSDDHQGQPYGFQYDVNDGHDNNFGHWQQSDGQVTTGSYRVQLPDGRTQIVTYRADENGYNAQVTYEPAAIVTTTPAPAPVKPLSFGGTTNPFYEFPGIPPYHGPTNAYGAYQQQPKSTISSNSYGSLGGGNSYYYETADTATTSAAAADGSQDSDESITENPTPNKVEEISSSSNLYGDISRIPLVYRSSKRSPPPSIESEREEPTAVNISKALDDTIRDEQLDENNDKQVESDFNDVVDFDLLPFPLPLPLAFRPV